MIAAIAASVTCSPVTSCVSSEVAVFAAAARSSYFSIEIAAWVPDAATPAAAQRNVAMPPVAISLKMNAAAARVPSPRAIQNCVDW